MQSQNVQSAAQCLQQCQEAPLRRSENCQKHKEGLNDLMAASSAQSA